MNFKQIFAKFIDKNPDNVITFKLHKVTMHLIFKFHCLFFKVLYKHCALWFPTVSGFKTGFLQVHDMYFRYKLLPFSDFSSLNMATFMWLHLVWFCKLCKLSIYDFNFFPFLVFLLAKRRCIFIYKTVQGTLGLWPKFLYMPEKLFDAAEDEKITFDNNFVYYAKSFFFNKSTFKKLLFKKKNKNKNKFFKKISFFLGNTAAVIYFKITNFIKFISIFSSNVFFFLRKQKCFNKGRYSRNRQLYRTGVYWCLYVNIVALLGLNYLFYKFTIQFSYYWWFLFSFFFSIFFSQFFKNKLYILLNSINIFTYFYSLLFTSKSLCERVTYLSYLFVYYKNAFNRFFDIADL